MKKAIVVSLAAAMLSFACSTTQTPKPKSAEATRLYEEIARRDASMFDAFNAHAVDRVMSHFSEDVEFFHDTGGLARYNEVVTGFKKLLGRNDGVHRDLVPGSLEVYPIKNYGAIETGAHRFCHQENGRSDCGTFKFLQVWQQQKDGQWKVTRVVSYGH